MDTPNAPPSSDVPVLPSEETLSIFEGTVPPVSAPAHVHVWNPQNVETGNSQPLPSASANAIPGNAAANSNGNPPIINEFVQDPSTPATLEATFNVSGPSRVVGIRPGPGARYRSGRGVSSNPLVAADFGLLNSRFVRNMYMNEPAVSRPPGRGRNSSPSVLVMLMRNRLGQGPPRNN